MMLPLDRRYHLIVLRLDDGLLLEPGQDQVDDFGIGKQVLFVCAQVLTHFADRLGEAVERAVTHTRVDNVPDEPEFCVSALPTLG